MNKPRADAVTKVRIRQLAADNPRLQQSEIAKLVGVSQPTVSRVLAMTSAPQPLPFSGGNQPPANVPVPNWSNDQPRPPPDRAYDPRYHGHTFQSFSAPQSFDGFDLDRIRNALSLHRLGNFLESSTLSMVLLGYAPVMAALGQRMAPALSLPRHMKYGARGLSRVLGERIEKQLTPRDGLFPSSQLPSTIFGATTFDLAFMGFGVWQHALGAPNEETGIRPLYTRRWPTWAVQYYRYRRTYVAITTDGPVDIINDGKFSLIADSDEPHFFGAILALAEEAFDGICTRRARASYIDRYGNPKWVGIMPEGVAPNSPEGNAMFDALGTIRGPDGYGVLPYGANLDVKSLSAGQSTVMNDAILSNWQHIAAVLLGSDGTMMRGAGVYTSPIFAAVARNIADRDLHCILRGVNGGHIATDLKYNHAQAIEAVRGEWIQPVLDIPLPDPEADARIKSYAERVEKFHTIIKAEREAGFQITQERAAQLSASLEIDMPELAPVDAQTVRLALAPADIAKVVRVDEARLSQGLPPIGDERGQMTISEIEVGKPGGQAPVTGSQPATGDGESVSRDTKPGPQKSVLGKINYQSALDQLVIRSEKDFDEDKHPRAPDGKFGSGSGSGSSGDPEPEKSEPKKEERTIDEVRESVSKLPDSKSDLESDYVEDDDYDELKKQKERFSENLSQEENNSVRYYSEDGFSEIRQSQINGFYGDGAEDAKVIHDMLTRESELSNPVTLYRGMLMAPSDVDALLSADEFDLLATSSFSPNAQSATEFAVGKSLDDDTKNDRVPVVIVGKIKGLAMDNASLRFSEDESLVPSQKMKIVELSVYTHPEHGEILVVKVEQ